MFHTPQEQIYRRNHLGANTTLHIGQTLHIPNPYVAQVRQLQAQIDRLRSRTQDQERKLQEDNSKERAFSARIVELSDTNRALQHDVTTLPCWRRATTPAVTFAILMFGLTLLSLLQWVLV